MPKWFHGVAMCQVPGGHQILYEAERSLDTQASTKPFMISVPQEAGRPNDRSSSTEASCAGDLAGCGQELEAHWALERSHLCTQHARDARQERCNGQSRAVKCLYSCGLWTNCCCRIARYLKSPAKLSPCITVFSSKLKPAKDVGGPCCMKKL